MMSEATVVSRPRKARLGDLLLEHKVISLEQLETALGDQRKSGRRLGRVLIENGYLTEDALLDFLSRQLKIPYVDLRRYTFMPEIVRLIPEAYARRFRAVALRDEGNAILVGLADPIDIFAHDEIARLLQKPLKLAVVKESDLLKALDVVYRRTEEISGLAAELEQELAAYDIDLGIGPVAAEGANDAPVVKLLQTIFEDAIQVNASDIHVEPDETAVRVRFRIDGELRVQTTADRKIAQALVSRLKLMAGLDISERRLPQDGRCQVRFRDTVIDVRMSTVPVQHGESVAMRLLNQSNGILELDRLGMPPDLLVRLRSMIHQPHGLVLVTGPTGSGKTTTLYGALKELNSTSAKLLTVEDPVEYRLPGVNQVQVNSKIDLTFARVLRAFLRQDPDIILIGEMRDTETVEIGLRAAMTGHLVLSSLHTHDAVSSAMRLMDMGAEPYLVAASLRGVVAQRLVRRVCESCGEPAIATAAEVALFAAELGPGVPLTLRRGRGCTFCQHTGFRGRVGIYELLEIDEALMFALQKRDPEAFSRAALAKPQYRRLRTEALAQAARGITTSEEALRAVYGVG
ncbi:MAG: GspE/PulE family protein [Acidiferrobacter sp.]